MWDWLRNILYSEIEYPVWDVTSNHIEGGLESFSLYVEAVAHAADLTVLGYDAYISKRLVSIEDPFA